MTIGRVTWWLALLGLLAAPLTAHAEIYYSADALPGQATCPDGDITWFMDPQQGRVIHALVRDTTGKNSERCEFATPQRPRGEWLGRTIYVGWRTRIDAPLTGGWNGLYQMKCHGTHQADQPLVIDMQGGKLTLSNHEAINGQETPQTVWTAPLPMNQWFSIVLEVRYAESRTEGTVRLWFNGQLQTLANGTTKHTGQTWDGDGNNMHWGIYRANEVEGDGHHYIWRPRVASTFEEADPNGGALPPVMDAAAAPDTGGEADGAVADAPAIADSGAGAGGAGTGGAGEVAGGAGASGAGGASGNGAGGAGGNAGTGGNRGRGGSGGSSPGPRGGAGGEAPGAGGAEAEPAAAQGCSCGLAAGERRGGDTGFGLVMLVGLALLRRRAGLSRRSRRI